jgi:predicted NBD/HSP70 family sugar kinase
VIKARAQDVRWRAVADVLRAVRITPGITRAALARELHLSSGVATEIAARLRELRLLTEVPAAADGRGRPTTVLCAHPDGPVVFAADLRGSGWRRAIAHADGTYQVRDRGAYGEDPIREVGRAARAARKRFGNRLRAVSLSVAGTVAEFRVVQAGELGWADLDLSPIVAGTTLPLLAGNDATLAAVAEARAGAARNSSTALHLLIDLGIGGALTVDGRPLLGHAGASGEFGHMPFGDPDALCACGAYGCWETDVNGSAMARHLGVSPPSDLRAFAEDVLSRTDAAARAASARAAAAFGRGVAGLVNAHDPEIVTLGGLAPLLSEAGGDAFRRAYRMGLMRFHREDPPPVVAAAFGDDGGLVGAIDVGLDLITSPPMLDAWANSDA